jgi:hypothetical protein
MIGAASDALHSCLGVARGAHYFAENFLGYDLKSDYPAQEGVNRR